jgi:hypothetical protein
MLRTVLGIVIGAAAGFAFYKFIGCQTGTCPITSSPFLSAFFGALIGLLVAGISITRGKTDSPKTGQKER